MQYDSGRLTIPSEKEEVLGKAVDVAKEAWEVLENHGDAHNKAECLLALSSAYEDRFRFDPEKFWEDHKLATDELEENMHRLHNELSSFDLAILCSKLSKILSRSKTEDDRRKSSKYEGDALLYCPVQLTIQRAELQYQFAKKILASKGVVGGLGGSKLIALPPLRECFNSSTAMPVTRLLAVVQSCKLLNAAERWNEVFVLASEAMEVFRLLPMHSLSAQDRQKILKDYIGFAPLAAAAGLQAGKPPADVLRVLEEGRDIIAGQRFDTRIDLTTLRQVDHELAEKFEKYREQLDPPGIKEMKDAAGDGAIVVISVAKLRCDAFIVRKDP